MTTREAAFVAAVFTTFVEEQLLWDGQFITYPLFKRIRTLDEPAFVSVHKDYVRSLGLPTYLPSLLYLGCTALLAAHRPARVPRRWPLLMNALNAVSVASTFGQLVPIHARIDRERRASAADVDRLIRYNSIRFGLTAVNSVILLALLARLLTPGAGQGVGESGR